MRIFAALLHPISDNNVRVILPVQTVHRCQPRSTSGLFIMASLPVSPAFLAGNHEVRERGDSERLQTLQTATSAWERKQREKKRMRRKRGNHALTSSLSLYQSTFSFTLIPVVENRLIGFQCFTGASLNAEGMVNNKRSQRIFRNGFWTTRRHWLCIFNATRLRLYIHAVMNAYQGNEKR